MTPETIEAVARAIAVELARLRGLPPLEEDLERIWSGGATLAGWRRRHFENFAVTAIQAYERVKGETDVTEELKPCPFCGGDDLLASERDRGGYQVICLCGATGPLEDTIEEAGEAWNRRDDGAAP